MITYRDQLLRLTVLCKASDKTDAPFPDGPVGDNRGQAAGAEQPWQVVRNVKVPHIVEAQLNHVRTRGAGLFDVLQQPFPGLC